MIQLEIQPLKTLLQTLSKQYQIYDVLVEAGATLSTAFLQEGLVDEMISYVAPTLLGQSARAMFNADFEYMAQQLRFKLLDVTQLDQDIRLRLILRKRKYEFRAFGIPQTSSCSPHDRRISFPSACPVFGQ